MSPYRPRPADRRVLVVGGRDPRQPGTAATERYLHEVTRRWAADGTRVTWAAPRLPGRPAQETIAGVRVLRATRPLGAVARAMRDGDRFDVVLAAGGPIGALPLVVGPSVPVVEVAHRTDRHAGTRSGQLLAGAVGRWSRTDRVTVALSPSARHDLRRRLGLRGPIFVVPPGTTTPAPDGGTARAPVPTVVVEAELVPQEGLDVLLDALPAVVAALPDLRVEILGDGPDLARLRRLVEARRLASSVTLHGPLVPELRDRWWRRAWLTACTGTREGRASRLLDAAAYGVPGVALATAGARGFVRQGRTGEIVGSADRLSEALVGQLVALTDDEVARGFAEACRAWAARFTWDRTAALLAGVVEHQIRTARSGPTRRRSARPDIATLVRFPERGPVPVGALRPTDEVDVADEQVSLLLNGCDELDALGVLDRLGATGAELRLAGHDELLIGPRPLPPVLAGRAPHLPFVTDRS
ncbi:glycosyltransferase family 4 protein [Micromonospora schwarzwaldensis]|uniref:glycosyltransferase family 4 protein n=1 Tax=Micromonospora sp. DSM 45708 TaxID=3111767 RepID=UPI0031D5937C